MEMVGRHVAERPAFVKLTWSRSRWFLPPESHI